MTQVAAQYEAGGVVQGRTSATLTSRIMAPVREVTVEPGARVRAGQVLVVLDDRDLDANARRARASVVAAENGARAAVSEREAAGAALALSEATHARVSRLHERKSATAQEYDEVTATLRSAKARAASAEARTAEADAALASARAGADAATVQASYAVVTAPFDGVVTEKLIDPGNMAAPGAPLLRLDATGAFRVDVRIDESRAGLLSPGQPVAVAFDNGGAAAGERRVVEGTVTEIARAVDADARAFLVKVALPETPDLRSGMFARVRFGGTAREALTIPADAVARRGQVATVFVVEKGTAHLRLVQTGTASQGRVEVLAGLDRGEAVVTSPPPALIDGHPVRTPGAATTAAPRGASGEAR